MLIDCLLRGFGFNLPADDTEDRRDEFRAFAEPTDPRRVWDVFTGSEELSLSLGWVLIGDKLGFSGSFFPGPFVPMLKELFRDRGGLTGSFSPSLLEEAISKGQDGGSNARKKVKKQSEKK
jgi:hypothetical protein